MDRETPGGGGQWQPLYGWKLVRMTLSDLREYRLSETAAYPLQVLSDGLQLAFSDDLYFLDLEPGPDEWSLDVLAQAIRSGSAQYVIAGQLSFDILDGPFI
ncbi:hypothetical protein ACIBJE_02655 [Micromonospora sp. NPDC050187]|uniref:hypothetical protein n=1 Tax=Micromonospora sp. NPDC050187 TaxID=3364277 RepID=UPI0037ACAAD2